MNIDEQKFQEYIQSRDKYKQEMSIKYDALKKITIPFGKYKGKTISSISELYDRRYGYIGKQYLGWVLNNVEINNELVKEAVEFYEKYVYLRGDGYD